MSHPDWISKLPNPNIPLHRLTLPGSHDAGVSLVHNSHKRATPFLPTGMYICQEYDIYGQLEVGSRFFDIRFDMKHGQPTTYHAKLGGWGESADSIVKAAKRFLKQYSSEFIILRITHTNAKTAKIVHDMFYDRCSDFLYKGAGVLAKEPIAKLRGKIILSYDHKAFPSPVPGLGKIRFAKHSEAAGDWKGIVTCGGYPGGTDIGYISNESVEQLFAHIAHCTAETPHLFMMYWQMTGGNVQEHTKMGLFNVRSQQALSPDPTAGTHNNLDFLLRWLRGQAGGGSTTFQGKKTVYRQPILPPTTDRVKWMPNIISMDFVNSTTCGKIIEFNQQNLTDAGYWAFAHYFAG